jgi:hypothetical protein
MAGEGFDPERIPAQMWMTAQAVVEASLAALGSGQVLVVPGEDNRAIARSGLQQQSGTLQ